MIENETQDKNDKCQYVRKITIGSLVYVPANVTEILRMVNTSC